VVHVGDSDYCNRHRPDPLRKAITEAQGREIKARIAAWANDDAPH
jgi:hypothetical protein